MGLCPASYAGSAGAAWGHPGPRECPGLLSRGSSHPRPGPLCSALGERCCARRRGAALNGDRHRSKSSQGKPPQPGGTGAAGHWAGEPGLRAARGVSLETGRGVRCASASPGRAGIAGSATGHAGVQQVRRRRTSPENAGAGGGAARHLPAARASHRPAGRRRRPGTSRCVRPSLLFPVC